MDILALQKLLGAMSGASVLVVGDVMVDRFVYGEVSRVSAEAPVPILARAHETVMLGAAGNVARNIAALGGLPTLIGVIGEDPAGETARALMADGLTAHAIGDPDRPTTTKVRFVSAGQQLLRVDHEEVRPIAGDIEAALIGRIADAGPSACAILLSDYGKGVVTPEVIAACLAAAKANGGPLIVDSKARHFGHYGAADIIKPNAAELTYATGLPTDTEAEVEAALARALDLCACRAILVTRAARGMSLAVRGRPVRHYRRPAPEVFDTAGAGDTALAALGLALAAGSELDAAVCLALLASSVAVEKAGVATVTQDELLEAELAAHREPTEAKIVTPEGMTRAIGHWRERGLKIGFTNGCFDILHPGHVAYLTQAKSWCDRLIVAVNSDASVRRAKGDGRPVNSLEARALVLAGLACVDLVTAFDEDTPAGLIAAARPDLLVKGGDYSEATVVGAEMVRGWGGEVKIAAFVEGYSTTATLTRASRG
ncbi:MAG: D-glycero-beta-D-manno-heptose 1-phosphate adenylyltransferase [Caulobacteraceae bacterium]